MESGIGAWGLTESDGVPEDPSFRRNYWKAGSFPGAEGTPSRKGIPARIDKAVGAPPTPVP